MNKVLIKNTEQQFEVRPSQTVLEAAIEAGIQLPYGCRNGACGACKGKILAGQVTHSPSTAISEAELSNGLALFCCAQPLEDLVIECRQLDNTTLIKPRIFPVRVHSKERLTDNVMRVSLQLPSSEKLAFQAGQYLEFILKDGGRRAFSIANAPHDSNLIDLHIQLIRGGQFTDYVFNHMPEKTILRIEAPLGHFYLREESNNPIIFVAGGTGFAPIKGIIEHILHLGIQREIHLYRGVKHSQDLYMDDLCQQWTSQLSNFKYMPVISEQPTDWKGKTGLVHHAVLDDFNHLNNYQVYASGSPAMIQAAQLSFSEKGLSEDAFFSDAFVFAAH